VRYCAGAVATHAPLGSMHVQLFVGQYTLDHLQISFKSLKFTQVPRCCVEFLLLQLILPTDAWPSRANKPIISERAATFKDISHSH